MKRVLLKLSGEALAGDKHTGFDEPTVTEVAKQVKQIVDGGTEVGIVIGGGNFWRGRTSETIDRTKADQIGMLATIMNCIYVSEIFRSAPAIPLPSPTAYGLSYSGLPDTSHDNISSGAAGKNTHLPPPRRAFPSNIRAVRRRCSLSAPGFPPSPPCAA